MLVNWVLGIASAITALATVILAVVTGIYAWLAHEANAPIVEVVLRPESADRHLVSLIVRNVGRTPAFDVTVMCAPLEAQDRIIVEPGWRLGLLPGFSHELLPGHAIPTLASGEGLRFEIFAGLRELTEVTFDVEYKDRPGGEKSRKRRFIYRPAQLYREGVSGA